MTWFSYHITSLDHVSSDFNFILESKSHMFEVRTWAANDDEDSRGSSAISEDIIDVEQRYVGVNLHHTHAEII